MHFTIPITLFDIGRICAKLKCPLSDFCVLVPAGRIEQSMHANVFLFDGGGKLHEMALVLKKREGGSCVFLQEARGCRIHGFHPLACRAYPFVFDGKGGLRYNKHFKCPRKWKKSEYDDAAMKRILDEVEEEIAMHDRIIRKWNAKEAKRNAGRGEAAFFSFIQDEISSGR